MHAVLGKLMLTASLSSELLSGKGSFSVFPQLVHVAATIPLFELCHFELKVVPSHLTRNSVGFWQACRLIHVLFFFFLHKRAGLFAF